jgi:Flp pilus assembly protein TadB
MINYASIKGISGLGVNVEPISFLHAIGYLSIVLIVWYGIPLLIATAFWTFLLWLQGRNTNN